MMKKNHLFWIFCYLLPISAMAQVQIEPQLLASGYDAPVDIAHAGDDRLFIVEQRGVIRILNTDGSKEAEPFMDIASSVNTEEAEQGLLGLAFHPDYRANGYFFVNYITDQGNHGTSRVSRFQVDPDNRNRALVNSEKVILEVRQPAKNHNGGDLAFGPDGYLYIGLGDGGSAGDPWGNSQNPLTLLGKMLRIDVDTDEAYAIPADNPFAGSDFELDEIWALGLRNPWRFSFDAKTGDLWMADVGQTAREEIDFQPAASTGGENYGWDCREGDLPYALPADECDENPPLIEPAYSYKVANNCNSVTGGFVYRGCRYPQMHGRYLYGEFCHGYIWSLRPDGNGGWINEQHYRRANYDISTFGEDADGELYIARWRGGDIYRLAMGAEQEVPIISYEASQGILSVPDTFAAYQWYFDGDVIDGANVSSLQDRRAGTFRVEMTLDNGCIIENSFLADPISSTKSLEGVAAISIQPNPSRDIFKLRLELPQSLAFQLTVINLEGKALWDQQFRAQGVWQHDIDLSAWPVGFYNLRIQTKEGSVYHKLVRISAEE
ncbi:MAG: PQQ-dependent sugar dehydrogenase [Bacteroidota bacterium]